MRRSAGLIGLGTLVLAMMPGPFAVADPIADFYHGKTVYILVGGSIGGEYDTHARLAARYMGRHIPGNPTIVPQNMVSAGGLNVANHLYVNAPHDGTYLGVIGNNFPALQAAGGRGIQFDAAKFQWIGAIAPQVETMAAWAASGVRTLEDARRREVITGAVSKGSMTYFLPAMLNRLLGTKFKMVTGYSGQGPINLAMERGEVEARENTWSGWKMAQPAWLTEKKVAILAQAGPRARDLLDVPSVEDLAKTAEDRQLISLIMSGTEFGRPLVAAPGVSADRVRALRDAFRAMTEDSAFLAEAATSRIEVNPVSGETMQTLAERIVNTPKPLAARAREFLE